MKALTKTNYRYHRVLEQFITAQGKIRARRLTNVSTKQHRLITRSIKKSRILARLPFMLSCEHVSFIFQAPTNPGAPCVDRKKSM